MKKQRKSKKRPTWKRKPSPEVKELTTSLTEWAHYLVGEAKDIQERDKKEN
ncbi:MAG: hypothetical protein WAM91_00420 [Candidatus Acidiferrales bacterium]